MKKGKWSRENYLDYRNKILFPSLGLSDIMKIKWSFFGGRNEIVSSPMALPMCVIRQHTELPILSPARDGVGSCFLVQPGDKDHSDDTEEIEMRQKRLYTASVVLALTLALLPFAAHPAEAATHTFIVTTTLDRNNPGLCFSGCSLREAITTAHWYLLPSEDTKSIEFNIPGCAGGVCTLAINPAYGPLPEMTVNNIIIDGTTQTANQGDTNPNGPEVEIDCTNSNAACLRISSAYNTIKGLAINRCPYAGVRISGAGADYNEILSCYIGTDASGELDHGNNGSGVVVWNGADHNQIGAPGEGNVISANGDDGVWISGEGTDDNSVTHNYIGTDKDGAADLGNHGNGVYIFNHADSNDIGSDTSGGHNIISGNNGDGIRIADADDNQLIVNYIGTNATGEMALGNGLWGIHFLNGASSNQVGSIWGVTIVSNNGGGILIEGTGTDSNTVLHSYIGTDDDGDTDRGNGNDGIQISGGAQGNTIGGDMVEERNVISGNEGYGVHIDGANNNTVRGNYIGTDESGGSALGNHYTGVRIANGSTNNTIGGDTEARKNVVSGNGTGGSWYDGVEINDSNANTVQGNYIGLRADGYGALANPDDGVTVINGDSNVIKDNVISGNNDDGLSITNGPHTQVTGNIIGLHKGSGLPVANGGCGIYVHSGDGVIIGGQAVGDHNTIAGNVGHGVVISATTSTISGTVVMGNHIGTNPSNWSSVGNGGVGVYLHGQVQYSIIGGDEGGEENVISGNSDSGIILEGSGTIYNVVSRNYIGLNSDGSSKLPNGQHGVEIRVGASYNTVGGGGAGKRNYIGGNDYGVVIYTHSGVNRPHHNQVTGNYIGTNRTGTAGLGNTTGVTIYDNARGNTAANNCISGNDQYGIYLSGDLTYDNVLQGNYIGTNASGTGSLANGGSGVYIGGSARDNQIGGTTASERNLISGNSGYGIWITGSNTRSNNVWGNYIGVNVNGTAAIGNANAGVLLESSTRSNNIGGTGSGEGNVIAGNGGQGISVQAANWNTIRGNTIGTNAGGADLGNSLHGIYLTGGAHTNGIGPGNIIAFNDGDGVRVDGSTTLYNTITATQIYSNTLLGIENINGGNTELPPPTITGTSPITGTACANCVVQIFSDYDDEGRIYHGFTTADATGNFAYSGSVSGPHITATATDGSGNTSEFSSAVAGGGGGLGDVYLPIITKNYP